MVSLGNESRRSGGHFFGTEAPSDADTEDLLRDPDSSVHKRVPLRFQRICTVWSTPVLVLLLVCLEVSVFILPHCFHDIRPQPFSILLYSHVFIWAVMFMADRLARWQHHLSRKQGYLEFYRRTCNLRRLPLFIVSIGNAVLLILTTLVSEYCIHPAAADQNATSIPTTTPNPTTMVAGSTLWDSTTMGPTPENITTPPLPTVNSTSDHVFPTTLIHVVSGLARVVMSDDGGHLVSHTQHCLGLPLTRENYLQIVFTVEVAVLVPMLLLYLVKVLMFNRRAADPDVLDQDSSTTSALQSQTSPMEIGFSEDPCMEELMEKQAEMIRYLKEHNSALGRRVMELTALNSS